MIPSEKLIYDYFRAFAAERPHDRFIFDEAHSYTVLQSFRIIKNMSAQLRCAGVGAGEEVRLSASRDVRTILNFFALQFIGAMAVLVDPHDELAAAKYIIKEGVLYADERKIPLEFNDGDSDFAPVGESRTPTITIFTSGSTGRPKAVRLSQYNFINNSRDTRDIGGYYPDDINIDIVPIHHVFGLALIFTAVVTRHAIFVPRSVQPDYIVESVIKYGATRLNGVPSLYLAMAESARAGEITTLRCGLIGGAPCTAEQFERIERGIGITLIPAYGLSECIAISCGSYRDRAEVRRTTVGRVYSMNEVRIAADGEILAKSPAMAEGAAAEDGWLHTGDLGYLDGEGYLHVSGRKKDIIIRNGNNLSAVAIEQAILALPEVKDACVVGISDDKEGEVPVALIVLSPDICADEEQISNKISAALPKPMRPKRVIISSAMPFTSSGKPDKPAIRALFGQ